MMDPLRVDIAAAGGHPSEARLLLALDRELDAPDATLVFDHLRACGACRATYERLALLSSEVEEYARTWPPEPAVVATTTPHRQMARWQRPWRDRVFSPSAAWLATAAAVLLLIATWLLLARGSAAPKSDATASNATAPNAAAPNAATPNATASNATTTASALPGSAPPRARDIALASSLPAPDAASSLSAASIIATELAPIKVRHRPTPAAARMQAQTAHYWALPYANGALPLSEGTMVMRVRLSRDQLRLAGIPISESQNTQGQDQPLVRAKVLVGADGLPRAISFDQN